MRIVGGTHRGTLLADVGAGDPGAHLRPTSDRVRQALFNMLCQGRWGDLVRGQRALDLFAGTGSIIVNNKRFAVQAGATIVVPDGATRSIEAETDLAFLGAQAAQITS